MDIKLLTLKEHIDLLNSLGYDIDLPIEDLIVKDEEYRKANIYYKDKGVGNIGLEERNLYYLYRDDRFIGNIDLNNINFSKRKNKNIRTLVHTRLFHGKLSLNCFNMLYSIGRSDSDDRTFISLSDNEKIIISKYMDDDNIEVVSLLDDVSDNEVLDELRYKKRLSFKIGDV